MMRLLITLVILAAVVAAIAYSPVGEAFGIIAFIVGGLGLGDPLFALTLQGLFFGPYVVGAAFLAFIAADRLTA